MRPSPGGSPRRGHGSSQQALDLSEARNTAAALCELGLAAEAFGCDVVDRDAVERAVAHAVDGGITAVNTGFRQALLARG